MTIEKLCVWLVIVVWIERAILICMLIWLPVTQIASMSHEGSWGAWVIMMLCLLWIDVCRRMLLKHLNKK